jgi:catechol 2,3-dioxygenase-like lactoylglutathione lyase family enzyme
MVGRRLAAIVILLLAIAAVAYLHDPPWLINQTTGLRGWEERPGQPRYRWSGGHASFFVRSDAAGITIPISTTFDEHDRRPMTVTVSVDDRVAARTELTDAAWQRITLSLPPPGRRQVRRIDVRTTVTREDNHGVRIGEVETAPRR